jgi:hypothetical protein
VGHSQRWNNVTSSPAAGNEYAQLGQAKPFQLNPLVGDQSKLSKPASTGRHFEFFPYFIRSSLELCMVGLGELAKVFWEA